MKNMINWLKEEESGQGMVEYALILVLLSMAAILVMKNVRDSLNNAFEEVDNKFPDVN